MPGAEESTEKVLFTISKSDTDEVRVRESNFKGKDYIDIRIYIKTQDGEFVPTKKGVMLLRDKMKELIEKLKELKI